MVKTCAMIAESSRFQNFITLVIILAGVLVGIETYPAVGETHPVVSKIYPVLSKIYPAVRSEPQRIEKNAATPV